MIRMIIPLKIILFIFCALILFHTSPVHAWQQIEEITSESGLRAWMIRDPNVKVTAIHFIFSGSGSRQDTQGHEGLANMVSGLLDEGAGERDSQNVRELLENHSISMTFSASRDHFSGKLVSLERHLELGASLLKDALDTPRFDAEPIARIKGQILTSIRYDQTKPNSLAYQKLHEVVFDDHPYARPVEGTEASVQSIKKQALTQFVKHNLVRSRLFIGISGPISKEAASQLIDSIFAPLPEGEPVKPQFFTPNLDNMNHHVQLEVPQSSVLFAVLGVPYDDPDYFDAIVLNYLLGGGSFESLMMQEIRKKRGLAYSTYSFSYPLMESAIIVGSLATRNSNVAEAQTITETILKQLREEPISEKKLVAAKSYLIDSYVLNMVSAESIASRLANLQRLGFSVDYLATRPQRFDRVTQNSLLRLANRLFRPDQLTWVTVGSKE